MKRVVTLILGLVLVMSLAVAGPAAAQDERVTGSEIVILNVRGTSNCSDFGMDGYFRTTGLVYFAATTLYDGQIVQDFFAPFNNTFPDGASVFLEEGFLNTRGRAVDVWPLTPGKKVEVFWTLYSPDLQPFYEARAVVTSCDSTTLKSSAHGPAHQLMENHSFETQSPFDADAAVFWQGNNTFNDSRVCDPPGPASPTYHGNCGFLFIAESIAKSKIKQTYTGTIGQKKDIVYLHGFAQSFVGYTGGAKVKAKLFFADGTSNTLAVTLPAGEHLYGAFPNATPFEAFMKLQKPIVSASVIIQQKFGSGNIAFDAVTLSVFTNSNTPLRALPVPQAGATPVNLLGG
ncbi:MAG: hypothetical protein IPM16_19040 [Chloroflexi bacterium]|nr:hypothetical protein [Chloroflexota bacterium]